MGEEFSVAIHYNYIYCLLLLFVPAEIADIFTKLFERKSELTPRVRRLKATDKFRFLVSNFVEFRLCIV
ncbi:hypothetical protein XaraCFBP7407_19015 [Xanthomonas arboricola pv. arracaciae]|nr:hypothetical protein XaraCFBP7407_19015 [Xanthomonas arboricola pv. arracaciae]